MLPQQSRVSPFTSQSLGFPSLPCNPLLSPGERVCVRRPHEHRGRMARDSQLENNLVYSDGLQSMLTLGEGGSAGVQFRGHGHRA